MKEEALSSSSSPVSMGGGSVQDGRKMSSSSNSSISNAVYPGAGSGAGFNVSANAGSGSGNGSGSGSGSVSTNTRKKRVSLACIRCKGRKTKCDGKKPCSACLSSNNECEYQVYGDMRKSKISSEYLEYLSLKNHALVDFVKSLELRYPEITQDAKAVIAEYKTSVSSSDKDFNFEDVDRYSGALLSSIDDGLDALDDMTHLGFKATAKVITTESAIACATGEAPGDFFSFGTSILPIGGLTYRKSQSYSTAAMDENLIAGLDANIILSNDNFVNFTLQTFKNNIGKVLLIVDDIDYNSLLNSRLNPVQSNIEYRLLCVCMAYGLIFSTEQFSVPFHKVFLKKAEENLFEIVLENSKRNGIMSENFTAIKNILIILLLLTAIEIGKGEDNRSWVYNSLLISQVQNSGMHINIKDPSGEKARLFWSIVVCDRINTNVLGMNSSLNYKSIVSGFYDVSNGKQSLISEVIFKYETKLWYINNKFTELFYSIEFNNYSLAHKKSLFIDVKNAMTELYLNLPDEMTLNNQNINNSKLIMFHISYKICTLTIRRPYLKCDSYGKFVIAECLRTCDEALQLISIYNNSVSFKHSPYYYSFLLFNVAIFQLSILTQPYAILFDTKERFIFIIKSLKMLSQTWERSNHLLQVLLNYAYKWKVETEIVDILTIVYNEQNSQEYAKSWTERFMREKGAEKFVEVPKTFVPLDSGVFM